jgi:hypothetical protein
LGNLLPFFFLSKVPTSKLSNTGDSEIDSKSEGNGGQGFGGRGVKGNKEKFSTFLECFCK